MAFVNRAVCRVCICEGRGNICRSCVVGTNNEDGVDRVLKNDFVRVVIVVDVVVVVGVTVVVMVGEKAAADTATPRFHWLVTCITTTTIIARMDIQPFQKWLYTSPQRRRRCDTAVTVVVVFYFWNKQQQTR
jgi:hypothetical protein